MPSVAHSVLQRLVRPGREAEPTDWVLVHDAARPCLRPADLDRLMTELAADPVGGILAVPVRDTMKQADAAGRIGATLDRARPVARLHPPDVPAWRPARRPDQDAIAAGDLVTDDAGAMERLGLAPRLIEGHADNLKITRAEDLPLARFYLDLQATPC